MFINFILLSDNFESRKVKKVYPTRDRHVLEFAQCKKKSRRSIQIKIWASWLIADLNFTLSHEDFSIR